MKASSPELRAYLLANNVAYRADLFTLTLLDGTVYRWTSCDVSLSVGGFVYESNGAVLSRGTTRQSAKLEVDNLDVDLAGTFTVNGLTLAALATNGFFDGARLRLDHLVMGSPGDVSLGPVTSWYEGRVAGVDPSPTRVALKVKSELEALNVEIPRFRVVPQCLHAFGDPNCGVNLATLTVTGNVTGAPTKSTFMAGVTLPMRTDGYYKLGVLAFLSGPNIGSRRAVRSYTAASRSFTLEMPLPFVPNVNDQFSVYPGCDKTWARCTVYANTRAFRGFQHKPLPEPEEV